MRAAIVFGILFVAAPAQAQFELDVGSRDFRRETGRLALLDIAIGEAALTGILRLCIRDGRLMIDVSMPISTSQSEYGVEYRVRREPNNMASLETVVGSKSGTSAKSAALNALARATMLDCTLFGTAPEHFFAINKFDGKASLSEMLKSN